MVQVQAPATIGNFGPGLDAFSLALADAGDLITVEEADQDAITMEGPGTDRLPTEWDRNVAGVTLDALRTEAMLDVRFRVRIKKGQPGASGLGSSASSGGGAALAFHALFPDEGLTPLDLVRAAAEGEAVAAGYHFDDVAAVILGGLAIVRLGDGLPRLQRIQPPAGLHLAVARPHMELATREMRDLLPRAVALPDAVRNVANAALLVDAFHREDVAAIGDALDDRISTPARKRCLPYFESVHAAALEAGAAGCGLSGSGPAMFAVTGSASEAERVAEAMGSALDAMDQANDRFTAQPERREMHVAVSMHPM